MGTGNAGKVTGSLWRRCSEPHITENESGPIRFEREMGNPTCVHRLKVYLTLSYTKFNVNLHSLLRVGLQQRDDYQRRDLLWGLSLFHQSPKLKSKMRTDPKSGYTRRMQNYCPVKL